MNYKYYQYFLVYSLNCSRSTLFLLPLLAVSHTCVTICFPFLQLLSILMLIYCPFMHLLPFSYALISSDLFSSSDAHTLFSSTIDNLTHSHPLKTLENKQKQDFLYLSRAPYKTYEIVWVAFSATARIQLQHSYLTISLYIHHIYTYTLVKFHKIHFILSVVVALFSSSYL